MDAPYSLGTTAPRCLPNPRQTRVKSGRKPSAHTKLPKEGRECSHANHISFGKAVGIVGGSGSEMLPSSYMSKKRCGATCGRCGLLTTPNPNRRRCQRNAQQVAVAESTDEEGRECDRVSS